MTLYTAAHYKNTPNDLQLMSDAPGHQLFVLLGPDAMTKAATNPDQLPDVLVVIQVRNKTSFTCRPLQGLGEP